jgi:O-antigen ligase
MITRGNFTQMNSWMDQYEKIKLTILILLVASLPYYLQISNVLIGLAALLTIARLVMMRRWSMLKIDALSLAIILYFVLEAVGLLYTEKENLRIGLFALDKHQGFILMPFIFSDVTLNIKSREKLLLSFVISCSVAALICIGVNLHQSIALYDQYFHEWLFSHDRVSEPIGMHAVYFALYLSFCILIVLNLLRQHYQSLSGTRLFLVFLLMIYLLVVIVALGGRTTTVALIIAVFVNLIFYARQLRSAKVYVCAALVPVVFAVFILLNPVVKTRFLDMLKDNYETSNYGSYFARTHIWVPGIDAIAENILVGVGTGDHQYKLNEKYLEHNYTEGVRLEFNMHNQYLQTALNFGMIGILLLLLIFIIQIKETVRQRDLLYASFLFLFMFACLTEAMLVVNKGTVFFLVFSFIFYNSKIGRQGISKDKIVI